MNINNSRTSNIDEFRNVPTLSGTMCESARAVSRQKSMLPEEILAEIFLSQHVNSVTDLSGPLWTYIQVCRSWRSAALNASSLWINIRVDGKFVNRRRSDHAQQIIQFILARSRSRPLSVDLDMLGIGLSDALSVSLVALLHSSHRWSSLRYSHTPSLTPFEPFQAIEPFHTTIHPFSPLGQFPTLTKITFSNAPSSDCRYVLRNAPHLERLALVDCRLLYHHIFLDLPFQWLRSLKVVGYTAGRNDWWPQLLRLTANLDKLVVGGDCWIGFGWETLSETIVLSDLRTLVLNDYKRRFLPNLHLPQLENIEIVASPQALSEVIRIVLRSSSRLKRVSVSGIELLDVTLEHFLRTIGSEVEELVLDGLVLNHLFDVISRPSDELLPRLEKITLRQSTKGRDKHDVYDPRCPLELIQQVSLPLESFITAVRARMRPGPTISRLKAVDISLSRSALDVQSASCLAGLEGLTSIIRNSNATLYQENLASIADLFTFVEKCIAHTSVPYIQRSHVRAAMVSFAYRRSDFTAKEQEFGIKERAKGIIEQLDTTDV
ncbi:hypothetical protein V5O48_011675 [Marasmius crinis-equi]|uniref:F-box domain-containing protein n=1 Tax=Marasmius crinis-equi TaxID=585013 RepID=A0ABR3F4Y7_9AGAR